MHDEPWLSLVDGPIGDVVARMQGERPELAVLAAAPLRKLAFRTFASIRVGLVLGEALPEEGASGDEPELARSISRLLGRPDVRESVEAAVEAVGREVAADRSLDAGPEWSDEGARARFLDFARQRLAS